jgi:hypothetical protein
VPDVTDAAAFEGNVQLPGGRHGEPGAEPKQSGLAGTVGPGDEQEPVTCHLEADATQNALVAVPLLKPPSPNHEATVVAAGSRPLNC